MHFGDMPRNLGVGCGAGPRGYVQIKEGLHTGPNSKALRTDQRGPTHRSKGFKKCPKSYVPINPAIDDSIMNKTYFYSQESVQSL